MCDMDLSKLNKSSLEGIVNSMLGDLKGKDDDMVHKYEDLICEMIYYISPDEALEIVRNMQPYGEAYSMETVANTISKNGIASSELVKYYLTMNMFYNDYKSYTDAKRLDINDFCFEMTKLFINDADGTKYKVEKYFK